MKMEIMMFTSKLSNDDTDVASVILSCQVLWELARELASKTLKWELRVQTHDIVGNLNRCRTVLEKQGTKRMYVPLLLCARAHA